jgi:gas vesicle protein
MAHRSEQAMSIFGVVTLAALAGAAAALLTAPQRGSETRKQIRDKWLDAKSKTTSGVEAVKEKTQDTVDTIKGRASDAAADVEDAVTEARSQVEDAVSEAKTRPRRTNPLG